jgi:malonyl-CoA O-methyltransferase
LKDAPPLDKRAVRRGFERAARSYDAAAVLHREIGRRLLEHLDPMRLEPARVVDLGCGTGAMLDELARRFPGAQLYGVDVALGMAAAARGRAGWWRRTLRTRVPQLVCADAERLPLAPASVDLLFSNLMLQWCDPAAVFAEAARIQPAGALLIFSSFGPDTLMELREAFRALDSAPHVHSFPDMHDLGDALVHAGFADPVMEMERITVEYGNLEALAKDLRAAGARNAAARRRRGLASKGAWARVVERYETRRRGGALPATYEVLYGHAWKTAPKRTSDGRQVIDFRPRGTG